MQRIPEVAQCLVHVLASSVRSLRMCHAVTARGSRKVGNCVMRAKQMGIRNVGLTFNCS
jgi:hypothetical protein